MLENYAILYKMTDIDDTIDFTDSDDDILGLMDTLVDIRSHTNDSTLADKSDTWLTAKRNKFTYNKLTIYKETKKLADPYIPSMEIIDRYKIDSKQNRYQRMTEVPNIIGFIVNVHDAINFDIDLEMSPKLHENYRDVISNQYTYQDLGHDFLENPDITKKVISAVGNTYRCRLRGVGMNQLPQHLHMSKSNIMCIEIKQLIDRTDGWITCIISDIDVYKRLLVDIFITTTKERINFRDYLLSRMDTKDPIFYPYCGKKDRSDRSHKRF